MPAMFQFSRKIRLIALAMVVVTLASCANMEPGMRLNTAGNAPAGDEPAVQQPDVQLITASLIARERVVRAQSARQDLAGLTGKAKPYVIGNGDLVSVLVWNHPELNIAAAGAQALTIASAGLRLNEAQTPSAYVVDQNGQIQFPYIGAISIANMTELEARDRLAEKLIKSIKQPDITLRVVQFRSKKVYIDGEVKSPGNQPIDDVPMTLPEALTRAGGLLPAADQSAIAVSRAGVTYPINLPELVRQGSNPSDIVLADGDLVRVLNRSDNKVFVLGEVNAPRALPMVNGRMTLTEALGEAGGLNQLSAAAKQVYVVRNANADKPAVFNLDAQSPVAMALADNFELNPRDVVFVDASGLARFNRIVTLILPNAASATASYYNVNVARPK
jgi:polysaccharide export outer membrane protein